MSAESVQYDEYHNGSASYGVHIKRIAMCSIYSNVKQLRLKAKFVDCDLTY